MLDESAARAPARMVKHTIKGISAKLGRVLPVDEWAAQLRFPSRKAEDHMSGSTIRRVVGVQGKSWDPTMFRDPDTILSVAKSGLASAAIEARDVDALLVVTCTPYEVMLDQDSFRFLGALGLRDDVPPIQLSAGCAGMARAMAVASMLDAENVLVLTYTLASCYMWRDGPNPNYLSNDAHPFAGTLWASAALFSDGAAAVVLSRRGARRDVRRVVHYSRDAQSFGAGPGFRDPLVHYLGGGALHPPGHEGSDKLACFGMNGERVKEYYSQGMLLNHEFQLRHDPGYVERVRRLYTHQAAPGLVDGFVNAASLPREKVPTNAADLGNLVTPCTLKLLHDDVAAGTVRRGDEVCFSVVGAGPERGTFITAVEVARPEVLEGAVTRRRKARAQVAPEKRAEL